MAKLRNPIFLVLLVLLFVEVLIVFPGQVEKKDETADAAAPAAGPAAPGPAEQRAEGVHLVESQGDNRDWELFAKVAEGDQRLAWNLKSVRVLFYSDERIEFTVTGDEGSIDTKSRDMRIRGNVETISTNGYTFKTEEVRYDAKSRRITSPTRVQMTGPADKNGSGLRVEGLRMRVDVDRSWMQIGSQVVARRALAGGQSLQLSSESAEFSGKSKQAVFRGKVVMKYGGSTVEGPEATFVSSGGDLLTGINVAGGVKVSDENKFATSENLSLDLLTKRFVFTGRPKVYQDRDELAGERIIFLDGGKKVKVENVRARTEEMVK